MFKVDLPTCVLNIYIFLFICLGAASQSLKDHISRCYGEWIISKGFQDQDGDFVVECEDRVSAFVDIVLSTSDNTYHGSDRLHLLNSENKSSVAIPTNQILEKHDKYVLLKGIAGIGKSSLLYYLATKWSNNEIWNDDSTATAFDFVFILNFRYLNTITYVESLKELLTEQYPTVFNAISFEELKTVGRKVLIILDGADEFGYIDELFELQSGAAVKTNIARTVYEILESERTGLNHNLLLSSRPGTATKLKKLLSHNNVKLKILEVSGFNDANIKLYVTKQFLGNPETAKNLHNILAKSENIYSMASVPFYLSIICILFKDMPGISPPKTATELYVWVILLFIRNHLRHEENAEGNSKLLNLEIHEVVCNYDIQHIMKTVFRLAYISLCENKIIFKEKDLKDINSKILISTGLLTKFYARGFEVNYQFRHLSMQEFFAAAYIFDEDIDRTQVINNSRLEGSLLLLAGLEGSYYSDSRTIVKLFTGNFFANSNKINANLIYKLMKPMSPPLDWYFSVHNTKWTVFTACFSEFDQVLPTNTKALLPKVLSFDYRFTNYMELQPIGKFYSENKL